MTELKRKISDFLVKRYDGTMEFDDLSEKDKENFHPVTGEWDPGWQDREKAWGETYKAEVAEAVAAPRISWFGHPELIASGLCITVDGKVIDRVVAFDTGEGWVTHYAKREDCGLSSLVTTTGAVTASCPVLRAYMAHPVKFT